MLNDLRNLGTLRDRPDYLFDILTDPLKVIESWIYDLSLRSLPKQERLVWIWQHTLDLVWNLPTRFGVYFGPFDSIGRMYH